ncbi:MAG: YajG family lipoprotein [Sulfuriferula sp.]
MNMKQIITRNKAIAAAVLTLSLTGCALTPATESLKYTPQANVQRILGAENISVNVVTTDSRVDKVIGNKVNGFGMKMAGISADEPVEITIDRAIEQEIKARGFHIDPNSGLVVNADVTKFYSKANVGIPILTYGVHSNVEITASVTKNNSFLYKKAIQGSAGFNHRLALGIDSCTGSIFGTASSDDRCNLERALTDIMNNLFNDKDFIAVLMATKPTQTAGN